MLKLILKDGERLIIGENISIKVERGDSRNRINVMIDAPREVSIRREEGMEKQSAFDGERKH